MTEQQRAERARRAAQAMKEFFEPAFDVVEQDYTQKIIDAAASSDPRTPEVIARLANGIKAMRSAKAMIVSIIMDGEVAQSEINRAERDEQLTAPQRRLRNIAPV